MNIIRGQALATAKSIAIVVSRFNIDITEALLANALEECRKQNIDDSFITIVHVPGAVEIGFAALRLAKTQRYAAIICFGAIIQGETAHFDYVAQSCVQACNQVMLQENIPVIFGVLTTFTRQQAIDRTNGVSTNMGREAIHTALEMISIAEQIK